MRLNKLRYYKADIVSGAKFHVSIGHSTLLSTVTLFYEESTQNESNFSLDNEYAFLASTAELSENVKAPDNITIFALIEFDHAAVIALNSKVLGSKLDTDVHTTSCRLAFEGQMILPITSEKYKSEFLPNLKVFKLKEKVGCVERANNEMELIGKNMFKKETNIHLFDGFKVTLSNGLLGQMDGPFGQSGKFKVRLKDSLNDEAKSLLMGGKKKKSDENLPKIEVKVSFKKYIFSKKMAQ